MAGNVIQLTIRVDDKGKPVVETFVNDTKKGMSEVEKSSTGVTTAFGNLKSAASTALTALAAVGGAALAAASSGLALARNSAQAGDEAYVLGQKLGITAEAASELDYWARSNGSSTEAMSSAMRALALSASQAASGSKQDVAAFKAIGLTVDDVNPSLHSMDEIFRTVVGAMEKYSDSGNKTAAGTAILGRGFTELKPALDGGVKGMDDAARAGKVLGVVFTNEAASAAHELNNSFDDLRNAIQGVTNTVGVGLFPIVKRAVTATTDWIRENKDLIAVKVKAFIDGVVSAARILGPIIIKSADAALELFDRLTKLNPALQDFAFTTAAAVVGGGAVTNTITSIADTAVKTTDTVINLLTNIKALGQGAAVSGSAIGLLGVGLAALGGYAASVWLEIQRLNAQSDRLKHIMDTLPGAVREAAQAFNDNVLTIAVLNARLQEVNSRLETARKAGRDTSGAIKGLTAEQQQLEESLKTLRGEQENANDALTRSARESREARNESIALRNAVDDLFGKSTLAADGMAKLAQKSGIASDRLRQLDAGAEPLPDEIHKLATALNVSDEAVRHMADGAKRVVAPIGNMGDTAAQTASKFSQLRDSAAQASAAALNAAVQQGDSGAVYAALGKALRDVVLSYNAEIAAADASGESANNVALAHEVAGAKAKTAVDALVKTVVDGSQKQIDALRQLDDQIGQSKLGLISQDLENLTEDWGRLSTEQRQAELPQVLDLLEQKYQLLVAAAERAAEAQHHAGESADEAARIDERLGLEKERLNGELEKEKKGWTDAAKGVKGYLTLAASIEQELDSVSQSLAGLAASFATDPTAWKSAARKAAEIFSRGFEDVLASQIQPVIKEVLGGLTGSSGLSSLISGAGSMVGKLFGSSAAEQFGPSLAELGTSQPAVDAAMKVGATAGTTAATGFGTAMSAALSSTGVLAVVAAGGAILANGVSKVITSETGNGIKQGARQIAAVTFPFVGIVVEQILEAFGLIGPDMEHRIASWFGRNIGKSLQDPEVQTAVEAGARAIGESVGQSLIKAMTHIPVKEIHKGLHDQITESFAGEAAAVTTEVQQLALAAGTAVSAQMGFVGSQAIAFSQAWAGAWIRAQVDAGKSAQQIIKELQAMDKALGTSGGIFAALDELQAKIIETGKSGEVFKDLSATVTDWTGKKTDVQSFSDVLAAFGGDAVLTISAIKKSLEDSGIAVEQFGGDLGDVVLAFTGAGEAIQAATDDYRKFGNEADGTGEILRSKVLSGLDDVIASAKDFPVESVDAFRSAIAMIPPEMLKNSEFVNALRDDFARMAAESHMSVRDLVDSIDPPLPAAMRNAILATNELGAALGSLSGAPLSSIKEVTDRMKQFAGDMYRVVKDETGKTTKVLTAFGEQTVGDLVNAVGGMWDTITADGVIATGEIDDVFHQIAMIPEEVFNDPAVQDAVHKLLAKIGEQTGDATLIALSASSTITKEQLDAATKQYDQWVKDHPAPPPPATTPTDGTTPDSQPTDASGQPTGPDTTGATTAPPPPPVPPETLKSWSEITESANAFGAAAKVNLEAVSALADATKVASETILAAIQPIIGTVGDGRSLVDLNDLFGVRLPQSVTDLTDLTVGKTGNMADSWDKVRGAVNQLTTSISVDLAGAITGLPDGDVTITTHYVNDGSPETGGGTAGDGIDGQGHTGAIVPGYPSTSERLYKVLPGEVLIPPDHDLSAAIRAAGNIESGIASYTARRAPGRGGASSGAPSGFSDGGTGRADGDVAGEVVSRLTQGGAIAFLPISRATMRDIADGVAEIVVLDKLPRLSAAGAVGVDPRTGVIKRRSSIPGPG